MKILIVGGAYQGKRAYAEAAFPDQEITIPDLHKIVFEMLEQGKNPQGNILSSLKSRASWLVTCDEVGGGVVPADAFLREYREQVGRLCCLLAAEADIVLRVVCGGAQTLKGSSL